MRITTTIRSAGILLPVLLAVAGVTTAPRAAEALPNVSVEVSVFHDALASHGRWHSSPRFGHVWRPAGITSSWRPYLYGQWVYTDYGWTFVSDDPWGWAAYHYGRWYLDPHWGWVWVPGTEWAPAWVTFYQRDDWIGWAPVPPGGTFSASLAFGAPSLVFVETRHFHEPHLARHAAPRSRNRDLWRGSRNVTRFAHTGGGWVNRSVAVETVERASRRPVPKHRVRDVASVQHLRQASSRAGEVPLFRPRIERGRSTERHATGRDDRRPPQADRGSPRGSRESARSRGDRKPPKADRGPARGNRESARGRDDRRPPKADRGPSRGNRESARGRDHRRPPKADRGPSRGNRESARGGRSGQRSKPPQR